MAPFDIGLAPEYDIAYVLHPSPRPMAGMRRIHVQPTDDALTSTPAPPPPPAPAPHPIILMDDAREFSGLPTVWRRVRAAEKLLQLIDKDAAVTSVVFICFYIGVLQAL